MQIIIPTAPLIEHTVGPQTRADGKHYRLMTYVAQQPVDDGLLLYHTLTRSMVLLTPDEASDITAQQDLIDRWFLAPLEHDDRKLCHQIRQMALLLQPAVRSITGYTILTTTGCNARCFYCYEKGTKPVAMTAETASKVARYVMAHRGDGKVSLGWFGGEPLVNAKVIDQICTELSEHDVPFKSTMISNGYLFDADMVQRAKSLWQLRNVQITLDGTAETYNRVKDYVYRDANAFERVLTNIALLTAAGIRVSIRLNVDKHNIGEMLQLVSLLNQRFGENKCLTVYSHALFAQRTPEDSAALYRERMQLEQQIAACGYSRKEKLQRDIKLNRCMADNDVSVVIAPDGHLGKCEHYVDREFFGHIDSEKRDEKVIRRFKERPADTQACNGCFYYPQCCRLVMCESTCGYTPEMCQEQLYKTKEAMKAAYEDFLNKTPNDNENTNDDETEI